MSIVCAAMKNGEVSIAADTQMSVGRLTVNAKQLENADKLFKVADSVVGIVGWSAMSDLFSIVIKEHSDIFDLTNRENIIKSLLKLHKVLKDEYFLKISEYDSDPVESMQLDGLIINSSGIFEIGSYREVNQFDRFWAAGSGRWFALGAMHALYDSGKCATEIAMAGVTAACNFDSGCSLPATIEAMDCVESQRIAMAS